MADPDLHVEGKALDRYEADNSSAISIKSIDDIKRLSVIFVESGMFKPDKTLTAKQQLFQAGVKIIAGVEFGIQPFAAMRGINIIQGNAEMSANLMAAKVKTHPKYDYRVKQWDKDGCVLTFYEYQPDGTKEELGESSFDAEDAKRANLTGGNWQKFARNMYFARAMSNGVRIHCPDIFYGAPVYTEGEIAGEFKADEDEPAAAVEAETHKPKDEPVEGEVVDATTEPEEPELVLDDTDEEEDDALTGAAAASVRWITTGQRESIRGLAADLGLTNPDDKNSVYSDAIERKVKSLNELNFDEAQTVIKHLQTIKQERQS